MVITSRWPGVMLSTAGAVAVEHKVADELKGFFEQVVSGDDRFDAVRGKLVFDLIAGRGDKGYHRGRFGM